MITPVKYIGFLIIFPLLGHTQELNLIKDQPNAYTIEQYHVLSANHKIRQGLYQKYNINTHTLIEEGYYKNNQPDSLWMYFDTFGKMMSQGYFSNGLKNGNWKRFINNNNNELIVTEGEYVKGKKSGVWVFRKPDGNLEYKYDYSAKTITEYGKNDGTFTIIDQKDTIVTAMDRPVIHVGGMDTLTQILIKNLMVPDKVSLKDISNGTYKVFVCFNINDKGKLEDCTALSGSNKQLNEEAIRVVKLWDDGNWVPGYYKGHAVKVIEVVPVIFNISVPHPPIGLPVVRID